MTPEEAARRVKAITARPQPSLTGWQVITEPDTSHAEQWTVYADLPPGLVHEDQTLYLRSDVSGEVITSTLAGLRDCHFEIPTVEGQLFAHFSAAFNAR